jgi:hypothetical protein
MRHRCDTAVSGFAGVTIRAVTSSDERDRRVRRLYRSGVPAVLIGVEVGLSRSQVHRIVAAGDDADDVDDDLTAEELSTLAAAEAEPDPVPPLRYCGMRAGLTDGRVSHDPVVVDATGREIDPLTLWRFKYTLGEAGDFEGKHRLDAELRAAILADGWRMCRFGDRIDWRQLDEIRRDGLVLAD